MYCNSCLKLIPKDEVTHCSQCGVPLCKKCANHCVVCGKELCDSCFAENHFKCEECFQPDKMFSVIRRSHIEQYAGCPYSLYLQLIEGIVPPYGKHAELGIIVHEIIDKASHYDVTLQEALAELEERTVEWNMSTDDEYSIITMELEETGKACLENFFLIKDSLKTDKFESEFKIQYSIDEDLPDISCTLDRISFIGDDIHIHDWKTGKPMAGKKLVEDLQPPLYLYAVYKRFGKMPKTFTLHYLKPNKHITYNQIDDMTYEVKTTRAVYVLDVNEALERTKKILNGIKHQNFQMPSSEWRCNSGLCWFGMSGKCKGVQAEQWKQVNLKYTKAGVDKNGTTKKAAAV